MSPRKPIFAFFALWWSGTIPRVKRSETLGIVPPHHNAKNANIGFLGYNIRVIRFSLVVGVPGVALTLHPRLRALRLKPSAFNLSGWTPRIPNNRSK